MNTPNLNSSLKVTNPDGSIHPELRMLLGQIINQLQLNLSDFGYRMPQQPTDKITQVSANSPNGSVVYDNDTHELKVKINGTFKTVQTS